MSDRGRACGGRRRPAVLRLATRSARPRPAGTPEVPTFPAEGELAHVEQLPSFVNEGHLYRHGDQHFLVYTGESGIGWDACATVRDRSGHWTFGLLLTSGADRAEAVANLRAWLERAIAGQDDQRGRAATGGP